MSAEIEITYYKHMRYHILLLVIFCSFTTKIPQKNSPVIDEMYSFLKDASTGFSNLKGEERTRDEKNGLIYYHTTKPVSDLADLVLFDKKGTQDRICTLYYSKNYADDKGKKQLLIFKKLYSAELNKMMTSGKYRVSNYTISEGNDEVYEVNDLQGNPLLEFHDNKEELSLMFWGKQKF